MFLRTLSVHISANNMQKFIIGLLASFLLLGLGYYYLFPLAQQPEDVNAVTAATNNNQANTSNKAPSENQEQARLNGTVESTETDSAPAFDKRRYANDIINNPLSVYYEDPEDYRYLVETCETCGVILSLMKASMQFGGKPIVLGSQGMFERFDGDNVAFVYNHILAIANMCPECAAAVLYAGRYEHLPLTIDSIDEFIDGNYQSGYMDSIQAARSDPEYAFFFAEPEENE